MVASILFWVWLLSASQSIWIRAVSYLSLFYLGSRGLHVFQLDWPSHQVFRFQSVSMWVMNVVGRCIQHSIFLAFRPEITKFASQLSEFRWSRDRRNQFVLVDGLSIFRKPFWLLMALAMSCRLGEASTPGPPWSIGLCNPAGLPGKAHLLAQHDVDLWLISETHLTSSGYRGFKADLRYEKSDLRWSVPGHHVQPRCTSSDHGNWGGVAIFSKHPSRKLPQNFSETAHLSSRLVCGTTCIGDLWVSGIVLYGVPKGPTHPRARLNTNSLLHEAIDRLQDIDGPKYLAGDFNHDLADLSASERLSRLGMIEIQDLFYNLTGTLPRPTCRGKTQRDFMFISHHLVHLFQGLVIDLHSWTDHASIVASFDGSGNNMVRFPWFIPNQFDWREAGALAPSTQVSFDEPSDPSEQYQSLWKSFEQRFQHALEQKGKVLPVHSRGRASRFEPTEIRGTPASVKHGRNGECVPKFFGCSFLHCHWFRQLRRLQSFLRVVSHASDDVLTAAKLEHRRLLWAAIRRAPGFAPDFPQWWNERIRLGNEPCFIPVEPPEFETANAIFAAVEWETRQLESRLNKERKSRRRSLVGSGLAKLYASVRRDAPAAVDVLLEPLKTKVVDVCQLDCAVEIDPPCEWKPDAPIRIQGQIVDTHMITSDKIYLTDVSGISTGDLVTQFKCTGSLPDIFIAFREQWAARWNRHQDVPLSHWENLLNFAKDKLHGVACESLCITTPLLRATAKAKKSRSAVGLDGVRRTDVLAMDSNQLSSIVNLFRRAHCDGTWPRQVLQGSVASLAKKPDPCGVGDFRPITVFSFVYRLWSTLQSHYWLAQIDTTLDPCLCGNRGARRAADLWREVLREVEDSHSADVGACGIVFDLEKAFNMLPRVICLAFVKLLGMEQTTLQAWAGALGDMERRFIIRGSASPPSFATCGFPEGCGLSCLAMLALDQVWHLWLRASVPDARPMSFVDNWEVIANSPEQIQAAFESTLSFTRALDLVVDQKKTFGWSTQRAMRSQLRSQGIVVKLDSGDLGAHLTYSKQIRNSSLIARFEGLADFWPKLRSAEGTQAQKMVVIRQAAWPRAMHGVAATTVGRKRFHSLRVQVLRAIGLEKPGANAWLQLHLEQRPTDPQFYALEQTVRDFRDLTGGDAGLDAVSRCIRGDRNFSPNSVTSILIDRIHWLGWQVLPEAWVHDVWGSFSLLLTSWAELKIRLQWAWHLVVAQQVRNKIGFENFHLVDPSATANSLIDHGPYERGILMRLLNGSLVTNQHAYHWSSDGSDKCIFCQQADSLMHRFWECPHHGDLRKELPEDVLQFALTGPPELCLHAWTLQSRFQMEWFQYLISIPEEPDVSLSFLENLATWDIFTDGSCLWQDQPQYRLASWAVCVACPHRDDASVHMTDHVVASAGPLPGLVQTSFRAEVYAILKALRLVRHHRVSARIWCDCQGVVDKFNVLTVGRLRLKHNSPNADLWKDIAEIVLQLQGVQVQVTKVDAHVDPSECLTEVDSWLAHHNNGADFAAKQANFNRPTKAWDLWEAHSGEVTRQRSLASSIRDFQIAVGKRVTEASRADLVDHSLRSLPTRQGRTFVMKWECGPLDLEPDHCTKVTLGENFSVQLQQWWSDLNDPESCEVVWLSFVQMYILFQLECRHAGLMRVGRSWKDPSLDHNLLPENVAFRVRARWFRMGLQQHLKDRGDCVGRAMTRPASSKLVCHIGCPSCPAKPAKILRVEQWLCEQLQGRCVGQCHALDGLAPAW